MKISQKGFTAVEGLLIVLIIAVVSFAGYYAWSQNKKDKPAAAKSPATIATKTTPAATVPAPKDETADWYEYQPTNKEYSVKLPDGWSLSHSDGNSTSIYGFTPESITFKAGIKATVSLAGGRDFSSIPFMLNYYPTDPSPVGVSGTKQSSFKTTGGVTVDKYYNLVTSNPEVMGAPKGTKQYFYQIKKGTNTIIVQHDIAPSETDQTVLIEKAIKTLVF